VSMIGKTDGSYTIPPIWRPFDELTIVASRPGHRRSIPKLEIAARALVKASETPEVWIARLFLTEALDAASDGLAEIDDATLPAAAEEPDLFHGAAA
jgi:hypothetical protein